MLLVMDGIVFHVRISHRTLEDVNLQAAKSCEQRFSFRQAHTQVTRESSRGLCSTSGFACWVTHTFVISRSLCVQMHKSS